MRRPRIHRSSRRFGVDQRRGDDRLFLCRDGAAGMEPPRGDERDSVIRESVRELSVHDVMHDARQRGLLDVLENGDALGFRRSADTCHFVK
jgi:hypothetical protein